jgi:hypothetical protein
MPSPALWVLVLSGILGFRVGMIGFPDWQVAVETAQVVAGFVDYPANNPFFIYHTKLWTSLHHLLALALLAGVQELTLSLVVSGVMGMLTFQALAMFVYALSRDVLVSVGAAALIFFSRSAEYGVVYPLFLVGTEHTYGVVGLSLSVLVVAVLGAGWYRTGAVMLGMAPCIHPSLGVWTGGIVALAIASDFGRLREELRPALPWFLAGCGITLVSLLIQYTLVYQSPEGMVRLSSQDLSTFVKLWDGHRSAINIWHDGVLLNVASLIVSSMWLAFFSADLPRPAQFLLRISAAGACLALALIPVSWISPDRLPTALLVLMPGRYLNFAAMTFVAMLVGLLGSRRELWSRGVLLFLTCGVLTGDRSMLWGFLDSHHQIQYQSGFQPLRIIWIAAAAAIAGAAWERWKGRLGPAKAGPYVMGPYVMGPYVMGPYVLQVVVLALVVLMTMHQSQPRSGAHFNDRTNDVFFAEVAGRPGVLLVAGDLHLVQLRTRRPVLVDSGALDTVMYSLETGASVQRILGDAYGLDLFNPPPDAIGSGRIPPLAHRRAWESFSPEKWRDIGRDFGVTQVLAYGDWSLQLPVAAQSRRLLLYDIPSQ